MKKRKQSGSSDLRTNAIPLSIHRYSNLPMLKTCAGSVWNVDHLQPFFPPIECLFKSENLEFASEYGIKFKNEMSYISPDGKIRVGSSPDLQDVHIKRTMLLSPYKWMQGDYGSSLGLPTTNVQASMIQSKLQNPNNAAYVGSIIASVLSESGCVHFPKVYGVFSGTAKSHTIDISDDYDDLSSRSWFSQNIGKTFELKLNQHVSSSSDFSHTRTAREKLNLGEEIAMDEVQELDCVQIETPHMAELSEVMKTSMEDEEDKEDSESSVSTSYLFQIKSCDCDEEEREIIDEEEMQYDSDEPFAWATFSNVPVQLTVMEKCDGLFYDLIMQPRENKIEFETAMVSQVVFALAYAQRNFGLVHNDLHANNIMYVKTDKEFLYYSFNGISYKVPTFGYIIKIIDFERGMTSVKLTGMKESKFFMSDHYSVNEEAGGQYNYHPFYISKFPEIKPNASFDLVRLATSMFWDMFPEGPSHEAYKKNPVFLCFTKWLTLEDGSSVLFGKEDPHHERYHGFTLYKAIVRYCKDTAVPRKELGNLKELYMTSSIPFGEDVILIDS
jgi:hypothetical protein